MKKSIKELRDEMSLAKKIKDVKDQEFLIAEAMYNLRMAEIELQRKIQELEKEQNGN
jgi:hypothetical protein